MTSTSRQPPPISWQEFKASFLPSKPTVKQNVLRSVKGKTLFQAAVPTADNEITQDSSVCSIKVVNGKLQDLSDNPGHISWQVQRAGTVFELDTAVPALDYQITIQGGDGKPLTNHYVIINATELEKRAGKLGVSTVGVNFGDPYIKAHAATTPDEGFPLLSVLIGNRLPQPGRKSTVHVVSLENFSPWLPDNQGNGSSTQERLSRLFSAQHNSHFVSKQNFHTTYAAFKEQKTLLSC